jgi:hypothetical protein
MERPSPITEVARPANLPDAVCDAILAAGYDRISVLIGTESRIGWRSNHGTIFIGVNGAVHQFDACGGFICTVTEKNS